MSRYFTSPPPVYARNWANGQNLVEWTKIERPIVDSKKLHRKEKKEKKKEKKLKKEKKSLEQKYSTTKTVSYESEQLEKSCLTEEYEQPRVGYLSDCSQNSKKRRRETSPAVVESQIKATPVAGKPLRIRIVFKKPKEAEAVPQEDPVCSTSGTQRPSELPSSVSLPSICDHDVAVPSTSLESGKVAIISESKKRKKHKPSKESRYNSLFDELVPPCISLEEDDSSSDDWLFGTSRKENVSSAKSSYKTDEDTIMSLQTSRDCSSLPRAMLLSEVGIFSLPYTVPF
uniref:Uncharacterized protein n=1 Tax=Arabidopsis thaliana TaxID=3702 RepID=Q8L9K6_ARATH|nr:unknown [Arabidopsis thaliana]